MEWINPFITTNKGGIPGIEAISTTATASAQVFTFNPHRFLNMPYRGLLLVKIPAYTAPGSALPIQFTTQGGSTVNLKSVGDADVTTTTLSSAGVYMCWVENGGIQLLSRTA